MRWPTQGTSSTLCAHYSLRADSLHLPLAQMLYPADLQPHLLFRLVALQQLTVNLPKDCHALLQGQQSVTDVADSFRSHVPLVADLAVASISGDVGQSARQVDALKDICACFEQLPKVQLSVADLPVLSSQSCSYWQAAPFSLVSVQLGML